HLVAHQIDWIVAGKLLVNEFAGLSVRLTQLSFDSFIPAVSLRKFLLDDIGLDSHAEMVCLAREIRRRVHVAFRSFELRIPQVTPENASHAELVGLRKGLADLGDLPRRFVRAEIDRRAYRNRAKVVSFFNG